MLTETSDTQSNRSTFIALCCSLFRVAAALVPFPIPQTRSGRRRLTISYAAVALVMPLSSWVTGSVVPLLVLTPAVVVLLVALGLSVDLITDRPTSSLDERERRIRDSSLNRPLEFGIVLGVAIGFLAQWALSDEQPLAIAALMATSMLAFSARLIAIAWNLPDSIGPE